jgi:CspA family cold shock protein
LSESESPLGTVESVQIRGTVKWFNVVKGYGFLTPEDGSSDIFLHLTILRMAGHERLSPGATVQCEAVKGAKGLQVLRVVSVDTSNADPEPEMAALHPRYEQEAEPIGPVGDFIAGTVKWFNPHKGYGFICPDDGDQNDVFVHMVTLRQVGAASLVTGQAVNVRIADGPKGRQAAEIQLRGAPPQAPPEATED